MFVAHWPLTWCVALSKLPDLSKLSFIIERPDWVKVSVLFNFNRLIALHSKAFTLDILEYRLKLVQPIWPYRL